MGGKAANSGTELAPLTGVVERALRAGAFPAAQACVIAAGKVVHSRAHGEDHLGHRVTTASLFDLSSITKVAATTLAVAVLVRQGALRLDHRLSALLPRLRTTSLRDTTVREVLGHRSGLPPWRPYFAAAMKSFPELYPPSVGEALPDRTCLERARKIMVDQVVATEREHSRGQRLYSDVGFILLGLALENAASLSLSEFCRREIYRPSDCEDLDFRDLRAPTPAFSARQIVATGATRPRRPVPSQDGLYAVPEQADQPRPGEVDDDNAYALGGIAGQAGLFGTARELARLGWILLEEYHGADRLGLGDILRAFMAVDGTARPFRGLGFDRPSVERGAESLVGTLVGRRGPGGAVGHWGFTGCSLWLDLDRRLSVVLLTNRTWPSRNNVEGLRRLRPLFHDEVVACLDGVIPSGSPVTTGS